MKREQLKVGMKVRLAEHEIKDCYGGFISDMENYLGRVVTITDVCTDYFEIKEDSGMWIWDIRYARPVKEKKEFKTYTGYIDSVEGVSMREIVQGMKIGIDKVIINGKCVIMYCSNSSGKVFKAVANCQEGDTFDLKTGLRICILKIRQRTAEYELKKLMK